MEITDRKKEVINICLETFISKGLSETSVRDLGKAIKSSTSGIYYYFEDKDAAVIVCAEEAAKRLEETLIIPVLREIKYPIKMMARLKSRAKEMSPVMRFFATVCTAPKYSEKMGPVLNRLSESYKLYAHKIATTLNVEPQLIEPYVYLLITIMTNFMIFGETARTETELTMIADKLNTFVEKRCSYEEHNQFKQKG